MVNGLEQVLSISDLNISFGSLAAVRSLSMNVECGRITGIVGESGSGKSTLLRCIAGLLHGHVRTSGEILYNGVSLLQPSQRKEAALLRRKISYVFQDPTTSLDPLYTIRDQFDECIKTTGSKDHDSLEELEIRMLDEMDIKDPKRVLDSYPHQISGGMCQRVGLAMCLASQPELLLADEPTSALDVVSQAQVLERFKHIRDEYATTVLIVSHNIAAIAEVADYVGVMFRGVLVEEGTTEEILKTPAHPYTKDLIASVPRLDGEMPCVPCNWRSEVSEISQVSETSQISDQVKTIEMQDPVDISNADPVPYAAEVALHLDKPEWEMIALSDTHRVLPFEAIQMKGRSCC